MWENYLRPVKEPLKRARGKSIQGSHRAGNSAAPRSYNILIQGSFCRVLRKKHVPIMGNNSVQFSCSIVSDSLRPYGLLYTRLPCPLSTPRAYSNSCPLSQWYHPTISSSVVPFSSCLQSCPTSGPFARSQFFTSGGQSIGVSASASVVPMNIQDWSPLGWTGWISLLSKGFSRVFSNTIAQKHQFFSAQLSL